MIKIDDRKIEVKAKNFAILLAEFSMIARTIYEQANPLEKEMMKQGWNKQLSPFCDFEDLDFILERKLDTVLKSVDELSNREAKKLNKMLDEISIPSKASTDLKNKTKELKRALAKKLKTKEMDIDADNEFFKFLDDLN